MKTANDRIGCFPMGFVAVLVAAGLLCGGCSLTTGALTGAGGVLGAVQTADEALAAKYGVPKSVVQTVRTTLGIPDARTQPKADQVLPVGWPWAYDVLDAEGKVVDVSGYHYGDTPRLRKAGSLPVSTFMQPVGTADAAALESVLTVIAATAPATAATNAPAPASSASTADLLPK